MIQIRINIDSALRGLTLTEQAIQKSNNLALRPTALLVLGRLQANMPVRTGRTKAQTGIKYFLRKDGFHGASIKTRGDRAHIAGFLEHGTQHMQARKVFERTWREIDSAASALFAATFTEYFEANKPK